MYAQQRRPLAVLPAYLLLLVSMAGTAQAAAADKPRAPNIVLIMADDE